VAGLPAFPTTVTGSKGGRVDTGRASMTTLQPSAHNEEPGHMAKTSKKITKKIDKLEKQADELRKKAEKKGKDLQSMATDKIDELSGDKKDDKGGKKGIFALLLAIGGGVAFALKRKRDQELDEALWEEPRSI
jgi:hypothetical protein